jgi:hypothetical protein
MNMKRLTDPSFKYVRSEHTDIRKTFQKIRKQLEAQKVSNVAPLKRAKS